MQRSRIVSLGATLALSIVSLALGVGSASATSSGGGQVYQPPTRNTGTYSFDPECAGQHLVVRGKYDNVDTTFNLPGSNGQAFLAKQRYSWSERWVDKRSGDKFYVWGRGLFRETSGTYVPKSDVPADLVPPEGLVGPVYRFTSRDTGRLTVGDGQGHVLRDRGTIVAELLFDTLGDGQPGGTGLDYQIVKVIGPHPSLDVDFCDLAADLLD